MFYDHGIYRKTSCQGEMLEIRRNLINNGFQRTKYCFCTEYRLIFFQEKTQVITFQVTVFEIRCVAPIHNKKSYVPNSRILQ